MSMVSDSKAVYIESVQLCRALKVRAEGLNLMGWIKES